MYTYKKFKKNLVQRLQEELPETIDMFEKEIVGNNHTIKTFLAFQMVHTSEVPTLSLQEFYKQYEDGEDLEAIVKKILQWIMDAGYVQMPKELLENWERAKEHIFPCLINQDWNTELLKDVVFEPYLELAIICKVSLGKTMGMVSHVISKEMLNGWNIREEELFGIAREHLKKQEFVIYDMREMLDEFEDENGKWMEESIEYVITNRSKVYGASALLRTDLLEMLAEKHNRNIYILPISVDELILILEVEGMKIEKLVESMHGIIGKEVEWESCLSDRVYYFDKTIKQVKII